MSRENDDRYYLTRAESETRLREADEYPRTRLLLAAEDIHVGDLIAAHSLKCNPGECAPIMGQAAEVLAINLPFVVVALSADADKSPLTLDVRFLEFMRVTKEFAAAQISPQKKSAAVED